MNISNGTIALLTSLISTLLWLVGAVQMGLASLPWLLKLLPLPAFGSLILAGIFSLASIIFGIIGLRIGISKTAAVIGLILGGIILVASVILIAIYLVFKRNGM
ncbi:MAG: hypothetical protein H7Y04_00700 [Verrucomicrobia bacterium]|nr:hypothetical protein [Cytophagales bacterium]